MPPIVTIGILVTLFAYFNKLILALYLTLLVVLLKKAPIAMYDGCNFMNLLIKVLEL